MSIIAKKNFTPVKIENFLKSNSILYKRDFIMGNNKHQIKWRSQNTYFNNNIWILIYEYNTNTEVYFFTYYKLNKGKLEKINQIYHNKVDISKVLTNIKNTENLKDIMFTFEIMLTDIYRRNNK